MLQNSKSDSESPPHTHTHTHVHTHGQLELINQFSKAAEYKINIQKSIIFLHTSNEHSENEIKKIFHL